MASPTGGNEGEKRHWKASNADSKRSGHFEERLTHPEAGSDYGRAQDPVTWAVVGGVLCLLGLAVFLSGESEQAIVVGGVGLAGLGLGSLGLAIDYVRSKHEIRTRVMDAGVELAVLHFYGEAKTDFVPFDDITSLQYADYDDSEEGILDNIDIDKQEYGETTYAIFHDTYNLAEYGRGVVRIGRDDQSAVYVESDRPTELAAVISESTPEIKAAETLY
jgi:hypothetical protein